MTDDTSPPPPAPADPEATAPAEPAPAPAEPVRALEGLVLEAPPAVGVVQPADAERSLNLDPADVAKIDAMVDRFVDGLLALDTQGPEFRDKVDDVRSLGDADVRASASVANALLDKPLASMQGGGLTQGSAVSKSLLELRHTVEDLDPGRQGTISGPRKLLGVIPFGGGDKVRDYFDKYRSSQAHLNGIIESLYSGQEELRRDNAAIVGEQRRLWETNARLRQYLYLAQQLDRKLVERVAELEAIDPARATALRQDVLFPVRQKVQDLATQLAVGVQGYLALDLVRKNNLELVKGVDRATTTTVSALRTAVITAQALADQKLVLDQISALNTTTEALIVGTSKLMREQSAQVHEQAAGSTVGLEPLQTAFENIYATIDQIDTFKLEALDHMASTVASLQGELAKSQAYLERARRSADSVPELLVATGDDDLTIPGPT